MKQLKYIGRWLVGLYVCEWVCAPIRRRPDVLEWWSKHEARMPNLSRMARQFLAVPACSASVERLFSLAGRIFTKDAQHMTTENLSERLWAKVNRINN